MSGVRFGGWFAGLRAGAGGSGLEGWTGRLRRSLRPVRHRRRVRVRTGPWLPGALPRVLAGASLPAAAVALDAPSVPTALVGLAGLVLALLPSAALATGLVAALAVLAAITSDGAVRPGAFAALALTHLAVALTAPLEGLGPTVRVELAALAPTLRRYLGVQALAQPTLALAWVLDGQGLQWAWLGPAVALALLGLALRWTPRLDRRPEPGGPSEPRVRLMG